MESDVLRAVNQVIMTYFNPRSPCGERLISPFALAFLVIFQSTLSVWRATYVIKCRMKQAVFQSTLSVWRATLVANSCELNGHKFQSTLSVWRATSYFGRSMVHYILFQSTLSVWRATHTETDVNKADDISIHALRVESDLMSCGVEVTA